MTTDEINDAIKTNIPEIEPDDADQPLTPVIGEPKWEDSDDA